MSKLLRFSLILTVLLTIGTATAVQLAVTPPQEIGTSFNVLVSIDSQTDFRGMEFIVDYDEGIIELTGASTTGLLASSSITVSEEDKVIIYSPSAINISGGIVNLHFKSKGSAEEVSSLGISNVKISVGTNSIVEGVISTGTYVTLGECVDHLNTKFGDGVGIPGTNCVCGDGTTLVISPISNNWACQFSNAESLFGSNAQDCSLGGDPIYDTGFCCIEGYQLNQSFNNFNDLLGKTNQACTQIPNALPRANIYEPPVKVTSGEVTNFSSLGSEDTDGDIDFYNWDFGDNTTHSSLANPSHVYASADVCLNSECTVSLTVTDDDGGTDSFMVTFTLEAGETPPPAPVCGNDVVENGEFCDGDDRAECGTELCKTDCSACQEAPQPPQLPDMQIGRTYTGSELAQLGLVKGKDNTITDGRIVVVNVLGMITDIRTQSTPPLQASVCGDGTCETGETSYSCLQDCHAGDGICQEGFGEDYDNTPSDCKKSKAPILLGLLSVGALGGGGYLGIKKGWVKSIGPFGHPFDSGGPSSELSSKLNSMAEQHEVAEPHKDLGKLSSYIKATRSQGFSYSQIKNTLSKKGWKEADINSAFSKIE